MSTMNAVSARKGAWVCKSLSTREAMLIVQNTLCDAQRCRIARAKCQIAAYKLLAQKPLLLLLPLTVLFQNQKDKEATDVFFLLTRNNVLHVTCARH